MTVFKNYLRSNVSVVAMAAATELGADIPDMTQYREFYKSKTSKDTKLDDGAIYKVVEDLDKDETSGQIDGDEFVKAVIEAEKEAIEYISAEMAAKLTAVAHGVEGHALKVAAFLNQNKPLMAKFSEVLTSEETAKRGPLDCYLELRAAYGDDDDKLNDLPIVGSQTWQDDEQEASNNADRYKVPVPKTDGGIKYEIRSFYAKLYDNTDDGIKAQTQLDYTAVHLAKESTLDDKKSAGDYLGMTRSQIIAEKKLWSGRQTRGRNLWRKAARVHQQILAVRELPKVAMDIAHRIRKVDGKDVKVYSKSTSPIIIADQSGGLGSIGFHNELSVSQFLSLKPASAAMAGGGYEALMETMRRSAADPKAKGRMATFDELRTDCYRISQYLDNEDNLKQVTFQLNKADKPTVLAIGRAAGELGALLAKVQGPFDRYEKEERDLERKRHDDEKAKAQQALTGQAATG